MLLRWLALERTSVVTAACHTHTGAATLRIIRKQGCVAAAEVIDLLLQLNKLALAFVSRRLSVLDSVEGVDAGGQIHACVCGVGCEWCGVLSLELRYATLQLTVDLFVGMCFALPQQALLVRPSRRPRQLQDVCANLSWRERGRCTCMCRAYDWHSESTQHCCCLRCLS